MSTVAIQMEDLPHYTYDDYVQWEGRWEIINGIPYAMVPAPAKKHQWISGKILSQLSKQLKPYPNWEVLLPVDWPISEDTVVQPDLLVVCDEEMEGSTLENTPVLIFEILSPSTRQKDRGIKYQLYEAAGVKYYCIVDPDSVSIEIYVLQKDRYSEADDFSENRIPFDLGPCQIHLDFTQLSS
jgi:Uma2 family endonuclease